MTSARVEVPLKPFQTPNFALVDLDRGKHGYRNEASLPIVDLTHEALDTLAEQWLTELYKKAGKRNPFVIREGERA